MLKENHALKARLEYNCGSSKAFCEALNVCASVDMAKDDCGVQIMLTLCLGLLKELEQAEKIIHMLMEDGDDV